MNSLPSALNFTAPNCAFRNVQMHAWHFTGITLVATAFFLATTSGFEGTDDRHYYTAALCWLNNGPCVGTEHWSLRLPPVLLTALSFRMFGINEFALILPQLVLYGFLLVFNYVMARRFFDDATAFWTTVIVAGVPLFVRTSGHLNVDLIETVCVVISLWLVYAAAGSGRERPWLLIAAGTAASLAWLTRETAAGYLAFVAVLFLFDRRYGWRAGLLFSVGAAPLVVAEVAFYWMSTGSPFYRLQVDLGHTQIPSEWLKGRVAEGIPLFNMDLAQRWLSPGIFHIHWLVDPYVNLLIHPLTGVLIPFAIIAGAAISKWRDRTEARRIACLLLFAGVFWIVFVNYVLSLPPQPRYYGPFMYGAAFIFGLWVADLMRRRVVLASIFVAVFLATAWPLVETGWGRSQVFAAKQLAEYLATNGKHVHTDPLTFRRARFYLDVYRVSDRIEAGSLADAELVFCSNISQGPCVKNPDGWNEVWRADQEPALIPRIITRLGLSDLLPERVVEALESHAATVAVYQRATPF